MMYSTRSSSKSTSIDDPGKWIEKFYIRIVGKRVIWKAKHGTLCFEAEWAWMENKQESLIFFEIIKRACHKFPHLMSGIVEDAIIIADNEYYRGYFEGVLYGHSQSEWSSFPKFNPWVIKEK